MKEVQCNAQHTAKRWLLLPSKLSRGKLLCPGSPKAHQRLLQPPDLAVLQGAHCFTAARHFRCVVKVKLPALSVQLPQHLTRGSALHLQLHISYRFVLSVTLLCRKHVNSSILSLHSVTGEGKTPEELPRLHFWETEMYRCTLP